MHATIDTQPTLDFESIVQQGDLCTFDHGAAWTVRDGVHAPGVPCSAFAMARVTRSCAVTELWCAEALEQHHGATIHLFCVKCDELVFKDEHFTITPI